MRHECSLEFRYPLHRFRDEIISLFLALGRLAFSDRFGRLFSGRLFGPYLGLGRLGFCHALHLWLGLALGPWFRGLGRLGAIGEDLGDTDHREFMAVAALTARILAPALLEGDHLVAARVLEHLAGNGRPGNRRGTELRRVAAQHEHFAEFDDLAWLALHPVDPDYILGGHPVLFAASFNDCEHRSSLVFDPGARRIPDRLLSVGFSCVFKGLWALEKARGPKGPRRPCL